MPRKRYKLEEILQHLRTFELDTGEGLAVFDAYRKLGITEETYYRLKKEDGGLHVDQAKRLKALEQESLSFKRIVANNALDLLILKEVASPPSPETIQRADWSRIPASVPNHYLRS